MYVLLPPRTTFHGGCPPIDNRPWFSRKVASVRNGNARIVLGALDQIAAAIGERYRSTKGAPNEWALRKSASVGVSSPAASAERASRLKRTISRSNLTWAG